MTSDLKLSTRTKVIKSPIGRDAPGKFTLRRTKIVDALMRQFHKLTIDLSPTETMAVVCDVRSQLNALDEKDLR